jgi:hypothetical protein
VSVWSGCGWKKAGGQTIVDLLVVLLIGDRDDANQQVMKNSNSFTVHCARLRHPARDYASKCGVIRDAIDIPPE